MNPPLSSSRSRKFFLLMGILIIGAALVFYIESRSTYPPTPQSLDAIDKDGNGVWDDMDEYIRSKDVNDREKKAIIFYVQSFQKVLLNPEIGFDVRNETVRADVFDQGFECYYRVFGHENSKIKDHEIKDELLKSSNRVKAWIRYNQNSSGAILHGWDDKIQGNPCPF